jgi:prepilin-type N-terminal cleavage/methylation domain-containing protein
MRPTTYNLQLTTDSGFTLIEVLVVLGILTILSTLGYLVTIDFYKSYAFNSERDTLVSILQKARTQSLSNINQSPHGVYMDGLNYLIFQGSSYVSRVPSFDRSIPVFPGISIVPQAPLPPLPLQVVFTQLSGDPDTAGNIVLTDGKRTATIFLNSGGQINW